MEFELVPFAACPYIDRISGCFDISGPQITCNWRIDGDTRHIRWPTNDNSPARVMGLWEHTCMEFFIGPADSAEYYEFNLSPAGAWNSFGFSDLRTGMHETDSLVCTDSHFESTASEAMIQANLDFAAASTHMRLGVSAVIEDTDCSFWYFALAHRTGRPDFHCRDNHSLEILKP